MITNWINTDKTIVQLSEEYHIPVGALEERYITYNIHKPYKYHINTARLFDVNDLNTWYLAGLTATDGYMPKGGNSLEIELTGDSELVLLKQI